MDFSLWATLSLMPLSGSKMRSVHCKINNEECEICMRWGDKIPYESATWCPPSATRPMPRLLRRDWALQAGCAPMSARIKTAQECLASLMRDKVDTTFVEKVEGKHTNYHYVLWYETTAPFWSNTRRLTTACRRLPTGPKWLYLSSLGENSLPYHYATHGATQALAQHQARLSARDIPL
jgi:hypothetical protein